MELFALLYIVVHAAMLGTFFLLNRAATRNWEQSQARKLRWQRPESTFNQANTPEQKHDQQPTPIRRAA